MSAEELRRQAEKLRPGITKAWAYLEQKGYVDEALEQPFDEDMVKYIIKEFDDLPEKAPGGSSSPETGYGSKRRPGYGASFSRGIGAGA